MTDGKVFAMKRRIVLLVLALAFVAALIGAYQFLGYNPTPTKSDSNVDPSYWYCNNSLELVTTGWEHPGGDALPFDDKALTADCIEQAQVPARVGIALAVASVLLAGVWTVVFVRGRKVRRVAPVP